MLAIVVYFLTQYASYTQRNLIKSNRNQIVYTIFRLIWNKNQRVRLDSNQSENGKCNLISVWFNKILKMFPCVYIWTNTFYCKIKDIMNVIKPTDLSGKNKNTLENGICFVTNCNSSWSRDKTINTSTLGSGELD